MRNTAIFAALICIATVFTCSGCGNDSSKDTDMRDAVKFRYHVLDSLGEGALAALDEADQGRCYEVSRPHPKAKKLIGGAPLISEGPDMDEAALSALRGLVFNDFNYEIDRRKRVPFVPQVAFVLESESESITILAALFTAQLRFVYGDERFTIDCDPVIQEWRDFATSFIDIQGIDEIPR